MIRVEAKVVFDIDMAGFVSQENRARMKADKNPMTDTEIKRLVTTEIKNRFKKQVERADTVYTIDTAVDRECNPKFGDAMPALRQARGLGPDDKSQDKDIEKYSSEEALRACCAFYAQSEAWAKTFMWMLDHCGFVVSPRYPETPPDYED